MKLVRLGMVEHALYDLAAEKPEDVEEIVATIALQDAG